jgi:hypothetical protein
MKFNPTDKSQSIIADIDFLLFGDSSTLNTAYSITDRTRNVNITYDEVISELFKADPNYMWDDTTNEDFPVATTDLTEAQTNYVVPDSSLIIHRVRVKNNDGQYVTLTPVNRRELTDSELNSTGTPDKYYKIDNAVFPIPVPDYGATDGVELEFQRGGNHFTTTDTDVSPGFNPQFHQMLSVGASYRYAIANGMKEKLSFLTQERERLRMALREHYERRSPDDRTRLRLKRPSPRNYGF